MIVRANDFGARIADILGLKHTTHIYIDIPLEGAVRVKAEFWMDKEDGGKLIRELESHNYELVIKDEE